MTGSKVWIVVFAGVVLAPGIAGAGPEKLGPGTIAGELAMRRQAWINSHAEPGTGVNWHTEGGQWETDENGNQKYVCLLLAAIVPTTGDEEGRLLTARLEVYYDPATDSVRSRRFRADGKTGWDYQRAPADEIVQLFPASASFAESESLGPDDLDFGDLPVGTGLTQYIGPLNAHKQELSAILGEIKAFGPRPGDEKAARRWALDLKKKGREALADVWAFRRTLDEFVDPRTRAGLREEIELAQESVRLVEQIVETYGVAAEYQPPPVTPSERNAVKDALLRELQSRIAERLGRKFHSEGLVDALNSQSLQEAIDKTLVRVESKVKQRVEDFTEEHTGLRFHSARSLGAALRQRVHQELKRRVAEVLLRLTGNAIIVEILGEPIVRWIENELWPHLKELFRQKGNHDARVQTSVASLDRARLRLYQLPPDARLPDVQSVLISAEGSVKATKYLVGDLERANRQDLLTGQMEPAKQRLERAASITSQRFLLHRIGDLEDLEPSAEMVAALIPILKDMMTSIDVPDIAPGDEEDEGDEGDEEDGEVPYVEFPQQYLVHIILTHTTGGPDPRDVWILFGGKPDENGVLLTPDGSGGVFVNKTDACHGPFTNSRQLCPVLRGLGLDGIWRGQQYISCKPQG